MSQTNQIIAVLFPLLGLLVGGLVVLAVRMPWKKRQPRMTIDIPVVEIGSTEVSGNDNLVLSPQARHRLHEEIAEDLASMERLLASARRKEGNLRAVEQLIQSSNGGNF
ncbi:hypothetical protein QWJ07_03125 [Frankia sp. RB7]|nr:hypothetical protein [Frankia sp. RB7]